ncbi:MAG: hypothetical protein KDC05_07130 [Bacteroidales bacterium]|nr:hypothetical protein [Bacteroidales bacterium]
MKKVNLLYLFGVLGLFVALSMSSCTKEGPQGPAGKDGVDGVDGEDGIDGTDGTATCIQCHDNSESIETKILQWGASIHATGGNYERNATDCAPCHTSQGFKERILTGAMETAEVIQDPSNINCYTCHFIHDTYTSGDYALRTTEPVTLWINGEEIDFGNGNLCVQCHQPRVSTIPDVTNPDGDYEVTSGRWGPHHGPQSTVVTGKAFYEVGSGYTNSMHDQTPGGCIGCHMADAFGSQAGGHSFNITYEYHGSTEFNLNGCVDCHGSIDDAEAALEEFEPEFEMLLDSLANLLIAEGIYNPDGGSGTAVTGTYSNKVAGAYWNFITLEEDRSMGVHNPKYTKKILENTIESLNE